MFSPSSPANTSVSSSSASTCASCIDLPSKFNKFHRMQESERIVDSNESLGTVTIAENFPMGMAEINMQRNEKQYENRNDQEKNFIGQENIKYDCQFAHYQKVAADSVVSTCVTDPLIHQERALLGSKLRNMITEPDSDSDDEPSIVDDFERSLSKVIDEKTSESKSDLTNNLGQVQYLGSIDDSGSLIQVKVNRRNSVSRSHIPIDEKEKKLIFQMGGDDSNLSPPLKPKISMNFNAQMFLNKYKNWKIKNPPIQITSDSSLKALDSDQTWWQNGNQFLHQIQYTSFDTLYLVGESIEYMIRALVFIILVRMLHRWVELELATFKGGC